MTHTLQPRWTIALTFCALAVAAACTSPKDDTPPPSIQVPSCTQISRFGNSATCTVTDAKLAACGTLSSRTCASSWLCFDAPEYADCGCIVDADCDPRTTYINDARMTAGKAPLASKCVMGRCGGRP